MTHPSLLQIKEFTYKLPDEKIARYPLKVRDDSRLLVYKAQKVQEAIYADLANHIPAGSLVVFNQTKVVHARLIFHKPSGGRIEVFCLEPDARYADVATGMLQQQEVYWHCLVGGAAKWKAGQELSLTADFIDKSGKQSQLQVKAVIHSKEGGSFVLHLYWTTPNESISFAEVLQYAGHVPLPPYLNREDEPEDAGRYQTIFARDEGSVAAPTAALHFTSTLLEKLAIQSIISAFVTLHVGAGTFKPVKSATMQDHEMHAEWMDISLECIRELVAHKKTKHPLVAVGTTSARSLESLYWIGVRVLRGEKIALHELAVPQWYPYEGENGVTSIAALQAVVTYMEEERLQRLVTRTQIIIAPGYRFYMVDGLVTNFHQPQSTLLLLVAALIGDDWKEVYNYALQHDFRFLSYGDGCLLWNKQG